jgi:transketolase
MPLPVEMVAVEDRFGESGKPEELLVKYGLDSENIVEKVFRVMERKGRTVGRAMPSPH